MDAKCSASVALFLALSLVLSNVAFSSYTYPPPPLSKCPQNTLKLKVCADVLNLAHIRIGASPVEECCNLIGDLIKANAAACLCTAIHANILGLVHLNVDLRLTALVNDYCKCDLPSGFHC